ncbi:MAG TPA: class I SAM-dependent methyltransferase [Gaiellaceae bacterium]
MTTFERVILDDAEPLTEAWERNAVNWIEWARLPGRDSYWRFHRDAFLALVPPPGRLTLDIGCGEGRLSRDLKALGHHVAAFDASSTAVEAARAADPDLDVRLADAARLPLPDSCADVALAFMSLQDIDNAAGAIREIARVLDPGGRLCMAIVHPINSVGQFESGEPDSPFTITGQYFEPYRYRDVIETDVRLVFESWHRPISWYVGTLADAGLLVEQLHEVRVPDEAVDTPRARRWQRLPLFLHIRALHP